MRSHDAADCMAGETTGLSAAVLAEIAELLSRFAETGDNSVIDLRGLPMTAADLGELAGRLGAGEVQILLDVAGRSEVWETRYAGVWWVRHLGADAAVTSEQIVISSVPEIVLSSRDDAGAAARRLKAELEQSAGAVELEVSDA